MSDRHFDTAVPESSTPNLKSSLGPTWESPSAETLVPHQIVFLEWQGTRLYAEVIQVIRDRQVCWVRPLVLAAPQRSPILYASSWFDASDVSDATRQPVVPDLIWPIHQFRLALDEDVLPFLSLQGQKFSIPGQPRPADATPLHQLQQFVASFCSPQASNASDTTVSDNCDRP
ncbi:hypothetical protein [Nodosilinea sp. P-1105]|uniref:hypothetical protein n=1 Tax=Nodosilinea sp. P-1105 TaxID=2546229 RepID=UPI00146F1854|nr:hypothetical protein [Nodosilinea sp. P-1105]NMF84020.1 hypothetical protein [Nodosilinea sp. P-1105]